MLRDTGAVFLHEEALNLLEAGGCKVNHENKLAKFPEWLVEECIRKCPSSFTLKARNPKYDIRIGGSEIHFANFPGLTVTDPVTEERRPPFLTDFADMVRLCDALEEVHYVWQPFAYIDDVPPQVMAEWITATNIRNTEKLIGAPSLPGSQKWIVKMTQAAGQDLFTGPCVVSPLTFVKDEVESLMTYARARYPVLILSGPSIGASGPATLAGSLMLQNAEILAGLVLTQLVNPGIGTMYCGYTTPMDMRYGTMASGAVEVGILAVGTAQLARKYRIPSGVFFPMTDSKVPDAQAAYEKHLQTLLCALAGINFIMPIGGLENESSNSAVQIVIDHEVCCMVARVLEGIKVTDETLAIDLINEVGSTPGHYMAKKHTLEWWEKEYHIPTISSKEPYRKWVKEGAKNVLTRARERAEEILKTHQPTPLPKDVDEEIDRILKEAEKEKRG